MYMGVYVREVLLRTLLVDVAAAVLVIIVMSFGGGACLMYVMLYYIFLAMHILRYIILTEFTLGISKCTRKKQYLPSSNTIIDEKM